MKHFAEVLAGSVFVAACSSSGDVQTGKLGARDGGYTGGSAGAGAAGAAGTGAAVAGGAGSSGTAGIVGVGGATGCNTTADCPQTNCFGCPGYVCIDHRCVPAPSSGTGGARPASSGGGPAGGTPSMGGALSTGGFVAAGAGGALPACGAASHLPQCEEYTRHTCALCDPAGCDESQLCYALSSCDSLYAACTAPFTCALAATTCAEFQACPRCQL